MSEEEFSHYLSAYLQASVGEKIEVPGDMKYVVSARIRAVLAVAAFDAKRGAPPRAPADVVTEVDRICAGVTPKGSRAT